MRADFAIRSLAFSVALLTMPSLAAAASCESLASLSLPNTTITMAAPVAPGGFTSSNPFGAPPTAVKAVAYKDLPAFCRVALTIKPTSDSIVKVEVWMPAANWNGKFMAVGNGGWAGSIWYASMASALARNYAAASTDTGHEGTPFDGSFAVGHPEKLVDFGYRAVHEMTLKAKAIVASYYGQPAKRSYWNGCSTGGRQGLMEAQRFPADYDGIAAGAPANNWVPLTAQSIWVSQAVHKEPASFVPPEKFPLIHQAAIKMCDTLDGVKDGVIENPMRCKFDPSVLLCKGADGPDCLTAPQVAAIRAVYAPAVNPRTKAEVYPGLEPGSELGWGVMLGSQPNPIPASYFRDVVFKDKNWDYMTLNLDTDVARAEKMDNGMIAATNPDLKAFFAHGGKLLQYHGWADNQISPRNSVEYYESVLEAEGGASQVDASYKLYMVPGMSHCRGGEGVDSFDSVTVLENWVENGKAPAQIVASRIAEDGKVTRSRPLCPYPQVVVYKGSGSTDEAGNFVCRAQ
jgi:feruloyl esterase